MIRLVDLLVVHTLIVSMVKNKSWHSNLILALIIRENQKQGEISTEFSRSKLLPMAIFSTKKSSQMGVFFCGQCPLVMMILALVDISR